MTDNLVQQIILYHIIRQLSTLFSSTISFVNVVHIGMRPGKRSLKLLGRIFKRMGAIDAQSVIANRYAAAFARIGQFSVAFGQLPFLDKFMNGRYGCLRGKA